MYRAALGATRRFVVGMSLRSVVAGAPLCHTPFDPTMRR